MKEVTIEKIIKILNANIENIEITLKDIKEDLTLLGMDSLSFVRIVVLLEEEFECEIPDSKLLISEMNTGEKIFNLLQKLYEDNYAYE